MTAETFNFVQPGLGTIISYCTTSGGTYTTVAQVKDIDGVSPTVGMWESTGLGSTATEQVPTIYKSGDIGFKVVFNPSDTTHTALQGFMAGLTLLYWKLTFPSPIGPGATAPESPVVYQWCGYITAYALTGFQDTSGVEADIKISVTGAITT